MKSVFLDNHSTTQPDPRVIKAMEPYFSTCFYNPSSAHVGGDIAGKAIEKAREQVASLINANPDNIYFTNSATEANNVVLRGLETQWKYLITTNTEHKSIIKCAPYTNFIYEPILKIDKNGNINPKFLAKRLKELGNAGALVSVIGANNEIGTIHALKKIGSLCRDHNILFHTDATQAIGKVKIDVDEMNIFALTMSGHKIYGPRGVGCLYIRNPGLIRPLIHGGYQNTFISGTQNTPSIVGVGEACRILQLPENEAENKQIKKLRDLLLKKLKKGISDITINGTMKNRLPNNLNITIPNVPSEILVKGLDDIMISGGSACNSGNFEPSHVILALGSKHPECAIRFGLGRFTTEEEIGYTAERIIKIVKSIRSK
jgi:cysteine desulfurase